MIVVLKMLPGSNGTGIPVSLLRDRESFERWLASDDYQLTSETRKTLPSVRGRELITIRWNGHAVGWADNQPQARQVIEHHTLVRAGVYLPFELEVTE